MNPQYMPQSQFGAPQQGFPPGKQAPGVSQPGLQDTFAVNSNLPPPQTGGYMQAQQPYGYKGPMGSSNTQNNAMPPPMVNPMNQQPPPRQVGPPPMQGTSQNTFNLPPHMQPNQLQNGPMTNSAPSSQPGQNPVANSGNQPPSTGQLGGAPLGPPPNNMGLNGAPYLAICPPHPSGLNQSMGPPPPSNSMGMPPMPPSSQSMGMPPMPPSSQSMGMPPSSQSMGMPPSSQSMGMPPSSQPMSMPPSSQPMGMPPSSQSMGMPPSSQSLGMPPSQPMGMPPTTGPMGMPPTTGSMGMPPTTGSMNMPPTSGSMSMPPTTGSMSMPPTTGSMGMPPTSGSMSMPPPSGPMNMPPPSGIKGMPPTGPSINPPPSNGPPPGPPQMGSMGPPIGPGQIGSPKMPNTMGSGPGLPPGPGQMEGSSQMGPPQMLNQVGAPNSGPGGPPLSNTTSRPGQIPNQSNYPLPGQMPPMPPSNMQTKSPLMPQMNSMGAPHMGGQNQPLPRGNNAGMPPMPPNQGQYSNKLGSSYPNMPPPSNQQYNPTNTNYGPNQLTNQMNEMHLNSNRQYPGGPMKSAINGDNSMNSPHMPPPMPQNQGQYINGSQNRATQPLIGYPPMPGQQQQMPGQQHQMPGQQHQMPGQQHQMPGGPYPSQAQYQQPQQPRRLDPDQMPSPIQVTLDDQKTRSGIFCTNQKGLVPPLVSTSFITQDQGNAGPRFIRSTMYNVPTTSDMMKQTAVPFGLVISPLARTIDQEYPPPIVDFGELGPVRCIRCKAYMCPFMQFIDSGRRFQCLFCKATTEVPAEYFQHLDHTGQRVDRYERPELILGTYEFVATKDYCRNNTFPKPPAIIFVIDVSYNNVKSGLVHLICAEMKEILKHLPIDQGQERSKMKVGFITYNSTVHFYNIKGTLAQPQMMVVGDTQEMFVPLLDGFLCDIEESAAVIDSLMAQIPAMFAETRETETVLMPAIQAGLEALKASECAGKLLVFHSTLPTAEAPGRLKNRDERKLLGTEKERTVLTPQNQAYNQLGQDCVSAGCSVDLFITNNSYIDIATIGQVARLTGGEIFKYTYFQADVDGQRLVNDIITDINRPIAFDSIMRVRTSTGVRPTNFYGHFFMSNTTDMEIAAIDCDKAVAIEIKHDDKLTEEEGVYIQVALLYTSCSGQRRLRILNLSLKTCSQMADLYRSCELDTIVNFFSKQCVYKLLENNPKVVKDSLVNRCAQMLACYRKNCASPSSAGQLILPECMKLLPLYVNCLLKSDAISGGSDMTLDDRSFVMQSVITMDIPTSVVYFYPRLIPLHEIQNGTETPEIPNSIRCTVEKMVDNGVYLLENGIHMLIWIGLNANQEWIQNVFGAPSAAQVDIDRISLPEIDNSLNIAVRNLIDQIRAQRHRCMRLTLVRQKDKLETVFRHFLMEDRGQDGSSSYVDFLCHMHKEIRQLLS